MAVECSKNSHHVHLMCCVNVKNMDDFDLYVSTPPMRCVLRPKVGLKASW